MTGLTRRQALTTAGIGLAAATVGSAKAITMTALETANTKLVGDFCAAWGASDIDPDKIAKTYLTDDCIVRFMDSQMLATGLIAASAMFKSFIAGGIRYELKILTSVATGPIVANTRIDTTFAPGQPPAPADIAGVFVVHQGKIKEWSDYFIRKD